MVEPRPTVSSSFSEILQTLQLRPHAPTYRIVRAKGPEYLHCWFSYDLFLHLLDPPMLSRTRSSTRWCPE